MSLLKVNTVETSLVQNTGGTGSPAIREMPAFLVRRTLTDQTLSGSNVATKIIYDTVSNDTNSYWDSVNSRYVPQIAGYYLISMSTGGSQSTTTSAGRLQTVVRINGLDVGRTGYGVFYGNSNIVNNGNVLVYLNGSTDYLEGFATITGAGTLLVWGSTGGTGSTFLSGFLVRPD